MEILDTSSKQCKILIQSGKKYVIRYPRTIGKTVEYYRSTPEEKVIEAVQNKHFRVPRVLYTSSKYMIQEYIEGPLLASLYQDHKAIDKKIIQQIVSQICFLTTLNGETLLNYASWKDNSSFYEFQCQNTKKVFNKYYDSLKDLYDKLGIPTNIMSILDKKTKQIHNKRPMAIIHGDRHKKNAILVGDEVVFIDWELGCIGDVAYDIAFHLHQMAYTQEDEEYFMKVLQQTFKGDVEELLKDISTYRLFILARSMLYHVYWTDLEYKQNNSTKEKQLGHFMRRYNKIVNNEEFDISAKTEDELKAIFQERKKEIESR